MYDIVTIGDCVSDLFICPSVDQVESFRNKFREVQLCFEHGSKISVDEVHYDIGGSACNVAVGLSRLGCQTALIGAVGADQEGEKIKERLGKESVEIKFLKTFPKNQTNFSVIIVYKGERTVLVYRGLKDYSLLKIPQSLRSKWLYIGPVANSFEPNYKNIISLVSEKNIRLAINPGHRQIEEGREKLKKLIYISSVLILNRKEATDLSKISGFSTVKDLLKRLKSLGAEIVVITDGTKGAYATDGESSYGIKAYSKERIDATGAGDSFSSGFLAYYMKNNDLKEALRWGIMNASEVVMSYGAQNNLPHLNKLQKLIDKAPDVYKL